MQRHERAHRIDGLLRIRPATWRSTLEREQLPKALLRCATPVEAEVEARHTTKAARCPLEEHERALDGARGELSRGRRRRAPAAVAVEHSTVKRSADARVERRDERRVSTHA